MKLVDNVIRSMRVGKVFRDNQDSINNIHFSSDGASLISSAEDDQIVIYDCERGIQKRTINSKKYGVDLIHFTQNKAHVVHASTKGKYQESQTKNFREGKRCLVLKPKT